MNEFLSDLRYAWRQLRKAPSFTVTAIVTLALGIGISATMFTVIDGVLLRPLPVPSPSQIVAVSEGTTVGKISVSALPNLRDLRAQSKTLQDIAWYTLKFFDLKKPDGSTQFSINLETSSNFFSMLQARPLLGRTFLTNTDAARNQGTVVLSYFVWKNYFHGDKGIVGKTMDFGNIPYTVIGVMPEHFYVGINDVGPTVWTALQKTPQMEDRSNNFLQAIGRLRPGVTLAAARTEMSGIQAGIARAFPDKHITKTVTVKSYRETLVGTVSTALWALMGAVLLVWLIACANVAGLLLTRMSARRREIAVRAALGASRSRIVRQFLTESLLIGAASGLLGLGIAAGCIKALGHAIHSNLSRSGDIAVNWQVVGVLVALSILSAVIFGTLPALHAAAADPQEALHEGAKGVGTGVRQLRLRNLLIVGELALSIVLLVSAGLLLRTLYALREVELGFNPQHLIVAQMFSKRGFTFSTKGAAEPDVRDTFYKPVLARIERLPGVESAAIVTAAPLAKNVHMQTTFKVIGNPLANPGGHGVEIHAVTPGAYNTLGIRVLQGRAFNDGDRENTRAVAVVNQAFAHAYLGTHPLGQHLNLDQSKKNPGMLKDALVVGVVANTPQNTPGTAAVPEVDVDMYQIPQSDNFYPLISMMGELVVRTGQSPQALVPTISRIVGQMNAQFVVNNVQTMDAHIDSLLGSQTLAARLLWIFAVAALLIAVAGLYGLLSFGVSQRTREIGVRIALGAQPGDILRMVLRQSGKLLLAGIVVGVVCASFATRLVRSFLYGVGPYDAATILAVCVALAVVGLLASFVPARRAARIEPTEALRTE